MSNDCKIEPKLGTYFVNYNVTLTLLSSVLWWFVAIHQTEDNIHRTFEDASSSLHVKSGNSRSFEGYTP